MKQSDYFSGRLADVKAFRELFDELVAISAPRPVVGGQVRWAPIAGREQEAAALRRTVAQAAGRASTATAGNVIIVGPPPAIGIAPVSVNAIANWSIPFGGPTLHDIPVERIQEFTDDAIGELEGIIEEWKQKERGLVGLLASAIRFPSAVREAAGFEAKTAQGRASAGFAVFVAATLYTAAGGLLVSLVLWAIKAATK